MTIGTHPAYLADTEANLTAQVPDSEDGVSCYVVATTSLWQLAKTSVVALGPDVLATMSGIGRWLRIQQSVGIKPLQRTIFVDNSYTGGGSDGSVARPYTTIQAAIDTIPTATTAAESRQVFVVEITPNDYDEELTVDITGKRIILSSVGPWGLGTFASADWAPSGTRRNITITGTAASIGGIRCAFGIAPWIYPGERQSTHQSYVTGARISGQILITAASPASLEIVLNAEVFGTTGTSAGVSFSVVGAPILQIYLYNGRFRGQVNGGTNANFQHAEKVRFDGLVTMPNYSLIDRCSFRSPGGFTVTSASPAGLLPEGFINTFFAAGTTFTGPAGSFRLDGYTNRFVKTNVVTLAGGATKVIYDDDVI